MTAAVAVYINFPWRMCYIVGAGREKRRSSHKDRSMNAFTKPMTHPASCSTEYNMENRTTLLKYNMENRRTLLFHTLSPVKVPTRRAHNTKYREIAHKTHSHHVLQQYTQPHRHTQPQYTQPSCSATPSRRNGHFLKVVLYVG